MSDFIADDINITVLWKILGFYGLGSVMLMWVFMGPEIRIAILIFACTSSIIFQLFHQHGFDLRNIKFYWLIPLIFRIPTTIRTSLSFPFEFSYHLFLISFRTTRRDETIFEDQRCRCVRQLLLTVATS